MKKILIIQISIISLITLIFCSCKKFVQIPSPKNQIVTSQVFADSTDADAAVVGMYVNLSSASVTSYLTLVTGFSSDELYQTGTNIDYAGFYSDLIATTNNTNESIWSGSYKMIYTANACIEGIQNSTHLTT